MNTNTILYIGNSYCTSLSQLQSYFVGLSEKDPLYSELLALLRDGIIEQWLYEGTTEEIKMAEMIKQIPDDLPDFDLLLKSGDILTSGKISVSRPNLTTYMKLQQVLCYNNPDNNPIKVGSEEIEIKSYCMEDVRFMLDFEIVNVVNEQFSISVFDNEKWLSDVDNISLKKMYKGKKYRTEFSLTLVDYGAHKIDIKANGHPLFTIYIYCCIDHEIISVRDIEFKMVHIRGGEFDMGSDSNKAKNNEKPLHKTTVQNYKIGQTVVTKGLWEVVMGPKFSMAGESDDMPVTNVSWNDCQIFIKKLNELTHLEFRLPTEAEWEFAARGGRESKKYEYSGSNNVDEVAWNCNNSDNRVHPVKKKIPNELNLYDMSGNVWEWCQDLYQTYDGKKVGSKSIYVIRGGSASTFGSHDNCRISRRTYYESEEARYFVGFRLALSE